MGRARRLKQERRPTPAASARFPGPSGMFSRVFWGAATGLFFAAMALLVGAVRIFIAIANGRQISFEDLHVFAFYGGGFILAGVVTGLLWPFTRTAVGRYAVAAFAAGTMLGLFVVGIEASPDAWSEAVWFSAIACTFFFGGILGRIFRTWREPVA